MSDFRGTLRSAKARLEEMSINEVSLVDQAANLRKLVVVKDVKGQSDMATNVNTKKAALKLPTAAKQGLMDGIGQVLDQLSGLAATVGGAETDDASVVPEELATALTKTAEMLTGMAQQYAPAAGAPAAPAPGAVTAAAPPVPELGKALDPTTKGALPAELHDGDSLKTLLRDGDSLKTLLLKAVGVSHFELARVEALDKAGRKIAGKHFEKLSTIAGDLGKLINTLAYAAEAEANAADPAAEKAAGDEKPKDKTKKAEDAPVAKANDSLVTDVLAAVARIEGAVTGQGQRLQKLESAVTTVSKAHALSNGGAVDGPAAAGGESTDEKVVWSNDMSADLAARNKGANK